MPTVRFTGRVLPESISLSVQGHPTISWKSGLSDVEGRFEISIVANAITIDCELNRLEAQNFTEILVGRCIQGIGGGGIQALAEIIVTDLVPLRQRGNYYGILSAMYAVGAVLGPILGGGFAENVTWVCLLTTLTLPPQRFVSLAHFEKAQFH